MGSSLIRAGSFDGLFDSYEQYFQQSIEIFANEVAKKWHKWLRTQPDFMTSKRDDQLQKLVKEVDVVASRWGAFREFLEGFLPANPSVRPEWSPVLARINQWLPR